MVIVKVTAYSQAPLANANRTGEASPAWHLALPQTGAQASHFCLVEAGAQTVDATTEVGTTMQNGTVEQKRSKRHLSKRTPKHQTDIGFRQTEPQPTKWISRTNWHASRVSGGVTSIHWKASNPNE